MIQRIAVLGGGFAGIATASVLAKSGADIVLVERATSLGGLAAGFQEPGWKWSIEHAYHHWFQSDSEVIKFCQLWGVQDNVVFHRPLTGIETRCNGIVQLDSAFSLLRYPELSLIDRLRMGASLAFVKWLPWHTPLANQSASSWCQRWMGSAAYTEIWSPLLRGKFGRYADDVGMSWLWARLHCRSARLGTYIGGFAALLRDVEVWLRNAGVHVKLGHDIGAIEHRGSTWSIEGLGEFQHVVAAVGTGSFCQIFSKHAPEYCNTLSRRPSLGAQVVLLSLTKALGPWYWISLRKEEHPFLAIVQQSKFVSADNFGGEHLVYVADYLSTQDDRWHLDDDTLIEQAFATCLRFADPTNRPLLNRAWVFRAPEAQPVMTPADVRSPLPTRIAEAKGLHHMSLAHVTPWDRGTNFALKLGREVAEGILEELG